jgi:hypothetical protein
VVAGVAAYHNSLGGPFIFDDPSSIISNPTIRSLWPPWAPLLPPHAAVTVQGRPVLNFSLALNYAVSGTNVGSYHALNVAIHLFAGLALFGIVRRTLLSFVGGPGAPRATGPARLGRRCHVARPRHRHTLDRPSAPN